MRDRFDLLSRADLLPRAAEVHVEFDGTLLEHHVVRAGDSQTILIGIPGDECELAVRSRTHIEVRNPLGAWVPLLVDERQRFVGASGSVSIAAVTPPDAVAKSATPWRRKLAITALSSVLVLGALPPLFAFALWLGAWGRAADRLPSLELPEGTRAVHWLATPPAPRTAEQDRAVASSAPARAPAPSPASVKPSSAQRTSAATAAAAATEATEDSDASKAQAESSHREMSQQAKATATATETASATATSTVTDTAKATATANATATASAQALLRESAVADEAFAQLMNRPAVDLASLGAVRVNDHEASDPAAEAAAAAGARGGSQGPSGARGATGAATAHDGAATGNSGAAEGAEQGTGDGPAESGGLGLTGIGAGGGGADGTIGLGTIGTIGKGGGEGDGSGYGNGEGRLFGRAPAAIVCRFDSPHVRGGLDKSIIRRVVRAHLNEVRDCYERALQQQPAMSGRVSTTFRIESSGVVSQATAVGDEMSGGTRERGQEIASCIERALVRWTFPQVRDGGGALVSYPFYFNAAP